MNGIETPPIETSPVQRETAACSPRRRVGWGGGGGRGGDGRRGIGDEYDTFSSDWPFTELDLGEKRASRLRRDEVRKRNGLTKMSILVVNIGTRASMVYRWKLFSCVVKTKGLIWPAAYVLS